jgi:hypothetical protein
LRAVAGHGVWVQRQEAVEQRRLVERSGGDVQPASPQRRHERRREQEVLDAHPADAMPARAQRTSAAGA